MMRRAVIALVLLQLSACAGRSRAAASGPSNSSGTGVVHADNTATATLWPRFFAELEGTFVATTPSGAAITVTRRFVSRKSAQLESFVTPSGAETITVYHPDAERILMTHYCGQGNQAVLVAELSAEDRVVFTGVSATNVGADQGVLSRLELIQLDDGYEHRETYTAGDEVETTTLHFVRQ